MVLTAFPRPAEMLPHRAPMLLLDEILDHTPGVSVTAATRILPDNPFFDGHFPGEPILPGVILVEMMFQTCGVFGRLDALHAESESQAVPTNYRPKSGRAIKIDTLTFNQVVRPNDRLRITATFSHKLLDFSVFKAQVEIEGRGVAAKGTVTVLITL